MPLAPVIASQLTPQTRVLSVYVGGLDVTADTKWDRFTVTDSGTNAKGTASIRLELTPSAATEIYDQALVRVYDHSASGGEVFRGFVISRRPSKEPGHSYLDIVAHDISSLLDDAIIDVELRQPESMQARIGFFWGKYAGQFLSGDLSFVQAIGGTLPLQRFEYLSLRNVIEMTIAQASSTADYAVDMLGKLHVWAGNETGNPAPKDIDADAPGAGEIAPESIDIDYDANSYANRVLVKYAGGTWPVQDDAAIAAANGLVRTATLQAPSVTTTDMAESLGRMYLGRVKTAKPRGVFVTTSAKADGWRGGQMVNVTSAAHGLTAQPYRIARVTTKVIRPGANLQRRYTVEFGGAWAGAGVDGVTPLIAGATAGIYMLDQLGDAIVSNAASASAGGLGPSVRRYLQGFVYNGDFYAPPPGPDAPIDDTTNPLPYWSVSGSGITSGTIKVYSVEDSAAPSGRVLRVVFTNAANLENVSISQLVPIQGARGGNVFHVPQGHVTNSGGTTGDTALGTSGSYRKADGVTTTGGGATVYRASWTALGIGGTDIVWGPANNGKVPADAYFLNFNINASAPASGSPHTGSFDVSDVWLETGSAPVFRGCIGTRTTTQTITTSTWTGIAFTSEGEDVFTFHSTGTNPSRFTVPTGWGGIYLLTGNAEIGTGTTGVRSLGWSLNGADPVLPHYVQADAPASAGGAALQITTVMELVAGDYVELEIWHNQGSDQTVSADARGTVLYIAESSSGTFV